MFFIPSESGAANPPHGGICMLSYEENTKELGREQGRNEAINVIIMLLAGRHIEEISRITEIPIRA
jgi:hypothetical protein